MDEKIKLIFIGDSSTSGIGGGMHIYPYKLKKHFEKSGICSSVSADNYAVPGFTSSDAVVLISKIRHQISPDEKTFIIIYLGNNELSASQYKGRYTHFKGIKNRFANYFSRKARTINLVNKEDKFHFIMSPEGISVANNLQDFQENMGVLFRSCQQSKAHVVCVVPAANLHFPAGLGLSNALWFKHIGQEDCSSAFIAQHYDLRDTTVCALYRALCLTEQKKHGAAQAMLEAVLCGTENKAIRAVAFNNLAVLDFYGGRYEQARSLLNSASDICPVYQSIFYYNLAKIFLRTGDTAEHENYLRRAYETDVSLYRVKGAVRESLLQLIQTLGIDHVFVPGEELQRNVFIDYCHPLEHVHEHIAAEVFARIRAAISPPNKSCRCTFSYRNIFPSPDLFFHQDDTLIDYYSIDQDSDDRIVKHSFINFHESMSATSAGNATLCQAYGNFVRENSTHPLFINAETFKKIPPLHWFEVLNFPEYYVYRVLLNYSTYLENHNGDMQELLGGYGNFKFSSENYNKLILRKKERNLSVPLETSLLSAHLIINNLKLYIRTDQNFTVCPDTRIKTILYWYTREAFRYGTQSRASMLFCLWNYEKIIEALLVCYAIFHKNNRVDQIAAVKKMLRFIVAEINELEGAVKQYYFTRNGSALAQARLKDNAFRAGLSAMISELSN